MKKSKIYLLFLLLLMQQLAFSQCEVLLWEENFDGTELNTDVWNIANDNLGGGNGELQYYTPRSENVYLEDGHLVLKLLKENYEDRIFTSGKITTKGHVDWKYGRIVGRMKLPEGQGVWPAFWMLPSDNVYGDWPNSGEIDIMELIGQDPETVYGTLHFGPPWNYTNNLYSLTSGKFSDGYFTFSIDWQEDTIKWYVEDILYSTKTRANMDKDFQWDAFNERFYLILNLAVGGNWPGPPDATTVFPQTMEVDWVKVYGDPSLQEIRALNKAYPNAKNVVYTMTDIPGAGFTWTVPATATIISGQGTHEITVDWGCDAGTVSLDVSNMACDDHHYDLVVAFDDLVISGDTTQYQAEDAVYFLPEMNGTTFTWEYPTDATIEGTPDDSLVMKWGCDPGYIKVSVANGCITDRDSLWVDLTTPLFLGATNVSQYATGQIYNISEQPDCQYTWSVPEGASIVDGQGTNEVEVDFTEYGGDVSVTITNTCGDKTYSIPIKISDTIIIADFETTFLDFLTFSGSTFSLATNPESGTINSSATVGETFKSEVAWSGIYADLGYELRFLKHDRFLIKAYGPKTGKVLFKIEDLVHEGSAVSPIEVSTNLTSVDEWQELVFDFSSAPDETFDRVTLFFDFGSEVTNTYYFDDILLLPKITGISESELDSGFRTWPNPFTDYIMLSIPYSEGSFNLNIYDMQGRLLYQANDNKAAGHDMRFDLPGLESGMYLLNITHDNVTFSSLLSKE